MTLWTTHETTFGSPISAEWLLGVSGGRVKALLGGTIPHPDQVPGPVMEGAQPVDGIEQMLVADPYWLKMYLEMMWNNCAVLIDTANPP